MHLSPVSARDGFPQQFIRTESNKPSCPAKRGTLQPAYRGPPRNWVTRSPSSPAACALPAILEVNEDIRMGGQVVTGIGFLGAGLIMRDGLNIRGLSTSATIWATGAIGVLAGCGEIFEAAEATLLILLINITSPRVVRLIERFVLQHPVESQRRRVEVRTTTESETEVRSSLMSQTRDDQLAVTSLARRVNSLDRNITIDVTISGDDVNDEVMSVLVQSLSLSPNILYCTFT